ncbi:uncharacterized protein LOC110847842 [Folsomia candida]|uniref:Minor outer capsid protein P2 n=1 Tax=Folsomia candida TaxID=158441 RepID=A0A226EME1_FOLCA|nr:uncharacterized protein LOC110847842 [Folsomia candida]OXA58317.1 Minor outer capsid protein P2 [Folsomia candida]
MSSTNRRRRSILKSTRNSILNVAMDDSANLSGCIPFNDRKRVSFGHKQIKEFQPVFNAESPPTNVNMIGNGGGEKNINVTSHASANMDLTFNYSENMNTTFKYPARMDVTSYASTDMDLTSYTPANLDTTSYSPADMDITSNFPNLNFTSYSPTKEDATSYSPANMNLTLRPSANKDITTYSPANMNVTSYSTVNKDVTYSPPKMNLTLRPSANKDITTYSPANMNVTSYSTVNKDVTYSPPKMNLTLRSSANKDITTYSPAIMNVTPYSPAVMSSPAFQTRSRAKLQSALPITALSSPQAINPVQSNVFRNKKNNKQVISTVFTTFKTPKRKRRKLDLVSSPSTDAINTSNKVEIAQKQMPNILNNATGHLPPLVLPQPSFISNSEIPQQIIPNWPRSIIITAEVGTQITPQKIMQEDQKSQTISDPAQACSMDIPTTVCEKMQLGQKSYQQAELCDAENVRTDFSSLRSNVSWATCNSDITGNLLSEQASEQVNFFTHQKQQDFEDSGLENAFKEALTIPSNRNSFVKTDPLKSTQQTCPNFDPPETTFICKRNDQSEEMLANQQNPFFNNNDCDTTELDETTETSRPPLLNPLNLSQELLQFVERNSAVTGGQRLRTIENVMPEIVNMPPEMYNQFKTLYIERFQHLYWEAIETHRRMVIQFGSSMLPSSRRNIKD